MSLTKAWYANVINVNLSVPQLDKFEFHLRARTCIYSSSNRYQDKRYNGCTQETRIPEKNATIEDLYLKCEK